MGTLSVDQYDAFHASRDHEREAHWLRDRLSRLDPSLHALLHVACATGVLDEHLGRFYEVDGLDRRDLYLEAARRRNPRGTYHVADLRDFRLDRLYDGILCLGGAIAGAYTAAQLRLCLSCLRDHLTPRGVLVLEPGPGPQDGELPSVDWDRGGGPDLRVVRLTTRRWRGGDGNERVALFEHHYLAGTAEGVVSVIERQEAGLFSLAQLQEALATAGFADVQHDPAGPAGRGLLVARARPATAA